MIHDKHTIESANEIDFRPNNYLSGNIISAQRLSEAPLRLRLWEIDDFLKCPVIGTCLDIFEQKQILKKEGIPVKNKSDFEVHEIIVGSLEGEDSLSRRTDSCLNRKFKKETISFFGIEEDEFIRLWKSHYQDGEIEGILWVAVTRPDLSVENMRHIFGDVHMKMHLNAKRKRETLQQLDFRRKENHELTQKLKEATKAKRVVTKENERLKKELFHACQVCDIRVKESQELELELKKLREENMVENLLAKNHELDGEVKRLSKEIKDYQKKNKAIESKNYKLSSKLDTQREMNDQLRKELEIITTQFSALNQDDEVYPQFDLSQKRILIVGGITKMESYYRQLIEENGGIFEYHDGYMKGGTKELEHQVKRVDVVLCPINYNSHAASLAVKKLCKKNGKPFCMLANSSLSTISNVLIKYQESACVQ